MRSRSSEGTRSGDGGSGSSDGTRSGDGASGSSDGGGGGVSGGRGSSEIVGATLVAAHAGEMISELTLAITNRLSLAALADTIHCYPTQAEVFQRIALQHAGPRTVAAAHETQRKTT